MALLSYVSVICVSSLFALCSNLMLLLFVIYVAARDAWWSWSSCVSCFASINAAWTAFAGKYPYSLFLVSKRSSENWSRVFDQKNKQENDAKGKKIMSDPTEVVGINSEKYDAVLRSVDQEKLDEM